MDGGATGLSSGRTGSHAKNVPAQQLGLSLVLADVLFCRDYAFWSAGDDLKAASGLVMAPYLSAFAVDSSEYLVRVVGDGVGDALASQEAFLVKSRLRAKLFSDRQDSFSTVLDQSARVASLCSEWFFRSRLPLVRNAKRRLMFDLGVCFLGSDLLCTTHVGFLNLGVDADRAAGWAPETLGRESHEMAYAIGCYTATVLELFSQPARAESAHAEQPAGCIRWKDTRSDWLYGHLELADGQRRDAVAIVLTSLLSASNTARLVIPSISGANITAVVKWQYVTLFHVVTCLRSLLDLDSRETVLQPTLRHSLNEHVMSLPHLTNAHRGLRNVLIHYGISKKAAQKLILDKPLCGLVEAYLDGMTVEDLACQVRRALDDTARVLSDVLPNEIPGVDVK